MLSNKVDLPASFGPWIRILPRWGKCRLISRKSLNRSTVRCLRIIMYFYSNGELPSRLSAGHLGDASVPAPLHSSPAPTRPAPTRPAPTRPAPTREGRGCLDVAEGGQQFLFCCLQGFLFLLVRSSSDPFVCKGDQFFTGRKAFVSPRSALISSNWYLPGQE